MTSEAVTTPDSLGTLENIMNSSLVTWIAIGILLYLCVLWIAIILWVTKDITNRTNNVAFQIVCISLVIFLTPIFGLVIYLIVRPTKTLIEKYYEEFELDLINTEEQLKEVEHCPFCNAKTNATFNYCTLCAKEIVKDCSNCKKAVRVNWVACPYCGHAQEEVFEKPEDTSLLEKKHAKKKSLEKTVKTKSLKEDSAETPASAL